MPRIRQPNEPSSAISRLAQLQQLGQNDDHMDMLRQNSAMEMLKTLYGMQQESQLQPDKLAALRASTAGREFETAQGQQEMPLRMQALQAGIQKEGDEHDLAGASRGASYLPYMQGVVKPEDLIATQLPGVQDSIHARLANEAKAKADAISADQAQQSGHPVSQASMGGGLGSLLHGATVGLPEALQNADTSMTNMGSQFWGNLFGMQPSADPQSRSFDQMQQDVTKQPIHPGILEYIRNLAGGTAPTAQLR